MRVVASEAAFCRPLVAKNHYTKTFPDSTRFCFTGWYGKTLAGVITFGMGVGLNQYKALLPDVERGEYLELTRLWSPDSMPRNTESRLIAAAMRLLPPEVRLVMSFADSSRGHIGTIYQATNFLYMGMTSGGKMLVTADGIEKHPRLLGIYRMRHSEYRGWDNSRLMNHLGYTYKAAGRKHRYAIATAKSKPRRSEDKKTLSLLAGEFPQTLTLNSHIEAIVARLSDDLLKPKYRKMSGKNKFTGHCYVASEALWHLLGGRESDYFPHVLRHNGDTHWFLKSSAGKVVDITCKQFSLSPDYAIATRCSFLTEKPSQRCRKLLDKLVDEK
jgi:hypothetical protein